MYARIDIHTHHPTETPDQLAILNRYEHFALAEQDPRYCSLGLHPWYLNSAVLDQQLEELDRFARMPNVLAIGECGLDKVTDTSFDLQEKAFAAQLRLATQLQKPLIIHCVRAFDELIACMRKVPVSVPVIIHGFNKHRQLAVRLLDLGYYLSFGKALLRQETALRETFAAIPADRFFLETDDAGLSIDAIYQVAAGIRKIAPDEINLQLQQNFKNVFGK